MSRISMYVKYFSISEPNIINSGCAHFYYLDKTDT